MLSFARILEIRCRRLGYLVTFVLFCSIEAQRVGLNIYTYLYVYMQTIVYEVCVGCVYYTGLLKLVIRVSNGIKNQH